jgi:2-polyprenyl-3-methyl-5-hydroxy-6-metoxy-1,4-benzoquinol methylase
MSELLRFAKKGIGYLFFDRSYARYYSPEIWDNKYASGYDLGDPKEDCRYGVLLALIRRYARGGVVLDAGCGDGLLEEKCRTLGSRMVGIDYSTLAIAKARERGLQSCEFMCTDYRDFSCQETFSLIVFNEALYYVEDYLQTLRSFSRFLAKDGVYIISMFDTKITRRMWRTLSRHLSRVHGTQIRDEESGVAWKVRVLRPTPEFSGIPKIQP